MGETFSVEKFIAPGEAAFGKKGLAKKIAIGMVAATLAFLMRISFLDYLGNLDRFITYYPAFMLAALLGGAVAGILATTASLGYWFIWLLIIHHTSFVTGDNILSIAIFLGCGILVSVISEQGTRNRERFRRKASELSALSDSLEDLVTQRTSELQAARALAEEERERLSVTLKSIGDGVITTDVLGRITTMNRVAEILTGWPQAEAVGQALAQVFHIIHEHTREICANPVEEVLKTGKIVELANHTILLARDGHERALADSGAPIVSVQGTVIGVVLVFRDMTEKMRMQEFLQRNDKLESLSVLAGGIAHDFNNLLSGIFGYLELIRAMPKLPERAAQHVEKALGVFERAKSLTHQLLAFSKGGLPVRESVDIAALLSETVKFALTGSNLSAEFLVAKDLAGAYCDKSQIAQVIDNLVINSKQASPQGGQLSIQAWNARLDSAKPPYLPTGEYVGIRISDNGPGIPAEIQLRIFDPFFTTKRQGQGLGLAMAYMIMKKHDGLIFYDAENKTGAAFTLYLPAIALQAENAKTEKSAEAKTGIRILVLDDEEPILDILKESLAMKGYLVTGAPAEDEFLLSYETALVEGRPFDLIILDLTIPGGRGGREIVRDLRTRDKTTPVLASSGYSNDDVMHNPETYGFTDKIQKPYRIDEISRLIAKYV
jgi:two-component system, cell cycle sensor histidine kinase and response regulator CckA